MTSPDAAVRPFLKWAGGKQWLSYEFGDRLAERLVPPRRGTYFEPFLGGGSVFFGLLPKRAVLSDSNADLIACYRGLRSNVEAVIEILRDLPNDQKTFERWRDARPTSLVERAARLIYLNKTAFNGIYRVNRKGQFNVPFGAYKNPTICAEQRLRLAAAALAGSSLRTLDYREALRAPRAGDTVYLDPPYVTGHSNNGFIKYNKHLFSWTDQVRLADLAADLRKRKVTVMVSNAPHQAVLDLYPGFSVSILERNSLIGGGRHLRGKTQEALLISTPHKK